MDDKKFSAAVDLLVEGWRLNRFTKSLLTADDKLRRKISNTAARFDKHFRSAAEIFGLDVVDFTGAEFDAGLPLTPINLADFASDENLFVEAMLEPTIKLAGSAQVIRLGTAILGRQ